MAYGALSPELQPRLISVDIDSELADAAALELRLRAEQDGDKCYGYFPAMKSGDIDSDLPDSQAFAAAVPSIDLDTVQVGFNFLRMSLVKQHASAPYHLDSDAATALTGNTSDVSERQVWRLLLNMSDTHPRMLSYLGADPFRLPISRRQNYIYCPPEAVPMDAVRTIAIPPRVQRVAQGVLFCSSQVLHSGQDDEHGHFVAAYGYDG